MTTPHIKNLDSRIRALCNILVDCHKYPSGFSYHIYDYQGEKLLRKKFLPKFVADEIFKTGLYDTNQIITSIEFPKNERQFKDFLEQIIEVNDTYRGREKEHAERRQAG